MLILKIALTIFFGTSTTWEIIIVGLYLIGLWGLFRKSGLSGWWALVPWVRSFMLGSCAGREPEGMVVTVTSFLCSVLNVIILILSNSDVVTANNQAMSLSALLMAIELISLIYLLRIFSGLIILYGQKRRWIWVWLIADFIPALLWGWSPKYQPAWKVEEFREELAAVTSTGSAEVLEDGLTVNLRRRTVMESFRRKTLLQNIYLSIPPGRMVLLLGGSGAGKTVFLNAICGYEKADASVMLGGGDMYRQYKKMQYQVGYAPQQDTMRGKDTIYSTLMDAAKLRLPKDARTAEMRERVEEVMDIFGLSPSRHHLVEKLSGGQRKRVSIAMEFISNPALFILDEPDSGLDGIMARELMEQLRMIADQGKIVIVITHTPDRVIDLFDDVIVLAKDGKRVGQLVYYGPVEEAKSFFGVSSMEDIVKRINNTAVGGEGRADEFIAKYAEVQHA